MYSENQKCDKSTGQCVCKECMEGRSCDQTKDGCCISHSKPTSKIFKV